MSEASVREPHPSWRFPPGVTDLLSPFQRDFCGIEYGRPLDLYVERCRATGLCGLDEVLDAGCGMGQWSIALSLLNHTVQAVDVDSVRLFTAMRVAQSLGRKNLVFRHAPLERLPMEDNSFDAVLCYSVIMFADLDPALGEMRRVLKPGGRLLVMADLWRWHWTRVRQGRMPAVEFAKMAVKRLLGYRQRTLFGRRYFLDRLRRHGFEVHQAGPEGTVGFAELPPASHLVFIPEPDPARPRLIEVAAYCRK